MHGWDVVLTEHFRLPNDRNGRFELHWILANVRGLLLRVRDGFCTRARHRAPLAVNAGAIAFSIAFTYAAGVIAACLGGLIKIKQ
jgi:hypothetical protein